MPRPQNKADLLALAEKNYDELVKFISSMSEDEKSTPFDFSSLNKKEAHWSRDKNVRDVICHLLEWHRLLLKFVAENRRSGSGVRRQKIRNRVPVSARILQLEKLRRHEPLHLAELSEYYDRKSPCRLCRVT